MTSDQQIFDGLRAMGFTCESHQPNAVDTESGAATDHNTVVTGPLTEETLQHLCVAIKETLLAQAKDNAKGFAIDVSLAKADAAELSACINGFLLDLGRHTHESDNTAHEVCSRIPSLDEKELKAAIDRAYDACDAVNAKLRELKGHLDSFVEGVTSPAPTPSTTIAPSPAPAGRIVDWRMRRNELP